MSEDFLNRYDLTGERERAIKQGATFERAMTWRDAAGAAYLLAGFTAWMQIRPSKASEDVILDLDDDEGITLADTSPNIAIRIEADVTAEFTFDSAWYDLLLIAPDGTVTRLLEGRVELDLAVTR